MKLMPTLLKTAFVFLSLFCLLGLAVFLIMDPLNWTAPNDHDLLSLFNQHRSAFEKLRQMAIEDFHQGRYFSGYSLNEQLTDFRKLEYKRLLSEIQSGLILNSGDEAEVRFIFASGTLSALSPGWSKGIEYLPGDSKRYGEEVEEELDQARKWRPGEYLRPIEGDWYIYYQRTVD